MRYLLNFRLKYQPNLLETGPEPDIRAGHPAGTRFSRISVRLLNLSMASIQKFFKQISIFQLLRFTSEF